MNSRTPPCLPRNTTIQHSEEIIKNIKTIRNNCIKDLITVNISENPWKFNLTIIVLQNSLYSKCIFEENIP